MLHFCLNKPQVSIFSLKKRLDAVDGCTKRCCNWRCIMQRKAIATVSHQPTDKGFEQTTQGIVFLYAMLNWGFWEPHTEH